MRVVLDTNVLVSALLSQKGSPAAVLRLVLRHELVALTTEELLAELTGVVRRPHILGRLEIEQLESFIIGYQASVTFVRPAPVPPGAVRDPADAAVLGAAAGGRADFIVTGDDDLLALEKYDDIRIVTPAALVVLLGSRPPGTAS